MKAGLACALMLGLCLGALPVRAQNAATSSIVTTKCQSCHGAGGDSVTPGTPRLNGQSPYYIVVQLRNFLDPGREDPHATAAMWGIARRIDDAALVPVAAYYARQAPMELPQTTGVLAAEGRKLYANGDAAEHIGACGICHGAHAEGQGANPRLGGQHGLYLKNQLERLRLALRASDTMHPTASNLTDRQIEALLAFLSKN